MSLYVKLGEYYQENLNSHNKEKVEVVER